MALEKSDLYASLWASCDELRGGMDASQYKDCVLFMLFIKYVSDKYGRSDDFAPPVTIPKGASFADMVALKGKPDIGDRINTQVIQPLIDAWERKLRLRVSKYFVQRMKTRWGSCNPESRAIRLNTELVKKPRDLLEYVVVHEMLHFREPTHGPRFVALLDRHYPAWRESRASLNVLPLSAETWREWVAVPGRLSVVANRGHGRHRGPDGTVAAQRAC